MKPIKNQYLYEITDRFGTVEVAPLNESDFSISYERETDGKYFYSKGFGGKLLFYGEMFERLQSIEQSIYICSEIKMNIYRVCEGGNKLYFEGFFSLTDGNWDLTRCTVEVKFKKSVLDKCLRDNRSVKVNLFQEIYTRITVKTQEAGGTLEYKSCWQNSPNGVTNDYWCGTGDPYAQNWVLKDFAEHSPDGVHFQIKNTWVREIISIPCGTLPAPDWVLVEDNCAASGTRKYAKKPPLYNCISDYTPVDANGAYSASQSCDVIGYGGTAANIDNGLLLNNVLQLLVSKFCGAKTIVSDFFQINPENVSDINYVTGERSHTNELVLFQKSDVKRPSVSGNASKAEITWDKLIETLGIVFNVAYGIDGDVIRLEHISFFNRNNGLDLTLPRYKKWVQGKNRYSYEVGEIPMRETFMFKETGYKDSVAGIIDYSNSCAVGGKEMEKQFIVDEFMTDVQYALNNPDKDSKNVDDNGFVLVATRKVGANYYIISEYDAEFGTALNNVLFFTKLLPRYHRHNRPLNKGLMNGVQTNMLSTKPIKKGETLAVPLCCDDVFNPVDTVLTTIGEGIVADAKYDLTKQMLELNLLYDVFDGLTNNLPPVIQGGNYTMYENEDLIFPINATDTDGTVVSVSVVTPPLNGTVEILSNTQGKFTPNPDFVGYSFFNLRAVDNWGEQSANASFIINVLPANAPPVAVDDSYNVFHGRNFYAELGIFNNDADDYGFTIVNPNITTALGVNIVIDQNGRFEYTPPAGYEGVDTFQYSITDNAGLTSTATVTLNISFLNKPVAVQDNYQTKKDTVLITDGTVGKEALFANDYTPDGLSYAYTCNVENKATSAGGNVEIQSNGLFTYTPPANFTGQDTFTYTVNNTNGSAVGSVIINVLPTVYVKLVLSDLQTTGHSGDDYWAKSRDYSVYFYSDAAGTQPLDVTGFGLKVKIKENWSYKNGTTSTTIWETNTVSGTIYKFYDDFVYFLRTDDPLYGYDITIS